MRLPLACRDSAQIRTTRQFLYRPLIPVYKTYCLRHDLTQCIFEIIKVRTPEHNRGIVDEVIRRKRTPEIVLYTQRYELSLLRKFHETREGMKIDAPACVIRRDQTTQLLTVYGDRRCRHKHPALRIARERFLYRRLHSDDRHRIEPPHLIHRNRGRRIAGNDDSIGLPLLNEKMKRLADEAAHSRNGFRAIGHMITVSEE